jgi:CheY-like chemotaxis protein
MQDDTNRYIKAGMDDFLAKPVDVKELESTLREYL